MNFIDLIEPKIVVFTKVTLKHCFPFICKREVGLVKLLDLTKTNRCLKNYNSERHSKKLCKLFLFTRDMRALEKHLFCPSLPLF